MTNPGEPVLPGTSPGDAMAPAYGSTSGAPAAHVAESAVGSGVSAGPTPPPGETSLIGRGVALLTPVFAIVAGWLAGAVAKIVPGAHLDRNQIVTFMAVAATAALTAAWKWLQGWQQHERLVASGQVRAVGKAPS